MILALLRSYCKYKVGIKTIGVPHMGITLHVSNVDLMTITKTRAWWCILFLRLRKNCTLPAQNEGSGM